MNNCRVCGKEITSGNFCDECRDEVIEDLEDLEIESPFPGSHPSRDNPEDN